MSEFVILVDEQDRELDKMEKILAHRLGLLHRAFSVFIFNEKNELLLQQRADGKYHSAGLWTNTCCSHPGSGEKINDAIKRRLYEEMHLICETEFAFSFIYKSELENGLSEYEYDHVYFGISNDLPTPEPLEVKAWKYINLKDLEANLILHPDKYTEWLKICFSKVITHFQKRYLPHLIA